MKKLTLLVKYKTKDNAREKFVDEIISSGILDKISNEDGCISYSYYYDAIRENDLLLMEEWESEEKQQKHLKSDHMKKLKEIKEKYVIDTVIMNQS